MLGLFSWFDSDHSATQQNYGAVSKGENLTAPLRTSGWHNYPGSSFRSASTDTVPKDLVLVKTAGNALQAVPQSALQRTNVVAVTVWDGLTAGQTIVVAAPGGRMVQAIIPQTCHVGQTFLVHIPPVAEHVVVVGVPLDLALHEETVGIASPWNQNAVARQW
jgi:hypothetical protein